MNGRSGQGATQVRVSRSVATVLIALDNSSWRSGGVEELGSIEDEFVNNGTTSGPRCVDAVAVAGNHFSEATAWSGRDAGKRVRDRFILRLGKMAHLNS